MYIWAIGWLFLRLEFVVETTGVGDFMINLIPCIPINISPKGMNGYRRISMSVSWLIFQISLSYYLPYMIVANEEGVRVNYFPTLSIESYVANTGSIGEPPE